MFTFLNISFFINFFYFCFALFIAFYIPGSIILSRIKLSLLQNFVLGTMTGMVLWGWQAYFFGYLNLRSLSYVYIVVFLAIWINRNKKNLKKIPAKLMKIKLDRIFLFLILAGSLAQLTSVFFTGVMTTKGLFFCCSNVSDNILNISITNQVIKSFPPFEPGYYGKEISNYHYWSSLVTGELIRVFKLPLIETNYQYMTVFISIFLGLLALVFSQLLNLGKAFSRWLIFFLYFGSDLIWFFVAVLRGNQIFEMFPLESGQQFLENIPRAMAVLVTFAGFSLFLILLKKRSLILGVIFALTFGSLLGYKVYFGFFIFPGLAVLAIYYLWKRNLIIFFTIVLTFLLAGAVYFPVNAQAGGLYYTGFWRFENFVVQPYLGELNRMELARAIFEQHANWLRIIQYELTYVAIFIVAIFGTKLLGFIQSRKSLALLPPELNIILFLGIISSFVLGSFFGQTSGGSNTFNFLVSIFIIGSIYTALSLSYFLNNRSKWIVFPIILIILFLTLTRTANLIYRNISNISMLRGFTISNQELEGLRVLRDIKTNSLVLADPNIIIDKDSPYISFITNQKMFLSGQGNELTAHNIDFSDRLKSLNIILYSTNPLSVSAELKKNKIGYLFLLNSTRLVSTKSAEFLKETFHNKEIRILEVKMSTGYSN